MKKLLSCLLASIMMLLVMVVPSYDVHAANVSLGVSASSVDIGDTVTVTASVPGGITAKVDIYFPAGLFEFVTASETVNQNGGTVATTLGEPFSSSITVKLKAKTTGTATITASVIQAGDSNTGDATTLGGASKSVTIANKVVETPEPPKEPEPPIDSQKPTQPEPPTDSQKPTQSETAKSGDSSLSSLKISEGKLSPSFKSNVTTYTTTVDNDVTKLIVSGTPSNKKASIESITGNGKVSLNVGSNTIKVVVKAENGTQTTYTLVVTRKSEEESNETQTSETQTEVIEQQVEKQTFEYNGQTLNIIEEIPNEVVPSDFSKEKISIDGKEVSGLKFAKGELQLLYLEDEKGSLYVYDKESEDVYPFIKIVFEQNYIILIRPDDGMIPKGFVPCTVSIEGTGTVQAYQYNAETTTKEEKTGLFGAETYLATEQNLSDLYFLYCINNSGDYGWYQFDKPEKTFQRYFGTIDLIRNGSETHTTTSSDGVPISPQTKNDYELQIKALKSQLKILITVIVIAILGVVGKVVFSNFSKQRLVKKQEEVYFCEEESNEQEDVVEDDKVNLEELQMEIASAKNLEEMQAELETLETSKESSSINKDEMKLDDKEAVVKETELKQNQEVKHSDDDLEFIHF